MEGTPKKTALTQTAKEYASRSSIHGIGYVFDRDLNFVDRLLWLLLAIAFATVAAALTWNFWVQWRNEQVMKTKELPINLNLRSGPIYYTYEVGVYNVYTICPVYEIHPGGDGFKGHN